MKYVGDYGNEEVRGLAAIRDLYGEILSAGEYEVTQLATHVVETDGIALLTSRWHMIENGVRSPEHVATIVLRRQPDGSWKNLIDCGPSVVG